MSGANITFCDEYTQAGLLTPNVPNFHTWCSRLIPRGAGQNRNCRCPDGNAANLTDVCREGVLCRRMHLVRLGYRCHHPRIRRAWPGFPGSYPRRHFKRTHRICDPCQQLQAQQLTPQEDAIIESWKHTLCRTCAQREIGQAMGNNVIGTRRGQSTCICADRIRRVPNGGVACTGCRVYACDEHQRHADNAARQIKGHEDFWKPLTRARKNTLNNQRQRLYFGYNFLAAQQGVTWAAQTPGNDQICNACICGRSTTYYRGRNRRHRIAVKCRGCDGITLLRGLPDGYLNRNYPGRRQ